MQQFNASGDGPIYHAGNGFYSPYIEPAWKTEKRKIRSAGNGIGFSALGYIGLSLGASLLYLVFIEIFFPSANIHGSVYLTETTEWLVNLVIYVISLAVPFAIYILAARMPLKVALPFRKAKFKLTLGGVFVCLGISVIASYATAYLQTVLEVFGIGLTSPEFETPETLPGIILYFITLAVAPAFIEEMIFRGIIMQSLRRFGDLFALITSSLIFGIFHLNLVQMPYAFILGLGIGYFVMRTGSLWVGVTVHFINNFLASVFEFLLPAVSEKTFIIINYGLNLVFVILAVISLVLILVKYRDIFRFGPSRSVLSGEKKVLYFITSPGLILSLIAAVIFTLQYIYII